MRWDAISVQGGCFCDQQAERHADVDQITGGIIGLHQLVDPIGKELKGLLREGVDKQAVA